MSRKSLAPPTRTPRPRQEYVKKDSRGTNPPPLPPLPFRGRGGGGGLPAGGGWEELLEQARKLSQADQKQLLAHLAADQQQATGQTRDSGMWLSALHSAVLRDVGGSASLAPSIVQLSRAMASTKTWPLIDSFMSGSRLGQLSVPERSAAYDVLADLVLQHAKQISERGGVPRTPNLLMNCASNISSIFDAAFPGYLSAGLATVIVRARLRTRDIESPS